MTKRWQDYVNFLLGLWLFVSLWAMGYTDIGQAATNAWIFGIGLMLFAAIAVYMPQMWEEIINALIGVWLIASPYVLGFSSDKPVTTNMIIVGGLALAF